MQHGEFAPRQRHRTAVAHHLEGGRVERQRAPAQQRRGPSAAAPLDRADAGRELVEIERLAEIVVGAGVEPGDAVRHLVAGGQQEHGRRVAAPAHLRQHVEAGAVGQHEVEHDRRVALGLKCGACVGAGRHGIRRQPREPEAHLETVEQNGIVLDDEHPHLVPRPPEFVTDCIQLGHPP